MYNIRMPIKVKKTIEECETLDELYENDYLGYITYRRYSEKMPVFEIFDNSLEGIKYNIHQTIKHKKIRDEHFEEQRLRKNENSRIYRQKKKQQLI